MFQSEEFKNPTADNRKYVTCLRSPTFRLTAKLCIFPGQLDCGKIFEK